MGKDRLHTEGDSKAELLANIEEVTELFFGQVPEIRLYTVSEETVRPPSHPRSTTPLSPPITAH